MNVTPVLEGNLTKRFLMSLATGQYVVSGTYDRNDAREYAPCFRESGVPMDERQAQWERIKEARADGRRCTVLRGEFEYEAYIKSLPTPQQRCIDIPRESGDEPRTR